MQKEELLHIIETAPVTSADKEQLKTLLENHGETGDFYSQFNRLLIESLKRNELIYAKVMEAFDDKITVLDRAFLDKKEALEKELSEKLVNTTIFDTQIRESAWNEYYTQFERAQKKYEEELKGTLSQLFLLAA